MSDVTSGDFGGFIKLLLLACHAGYLPSAIIPGVRRLLLRAERRPPNFNSQKLPLTYFPALAF
jgi:hypothetical protein